MVMHLRIQPSEILQLPIPWLEEALAQAQHIRSEMAKQNG